MLCLRLLNVSAMVCLMWAVGSLLFPIWAADRPVVSDWYPRAQSRLQGAIDIEVHELQARSVESLNALEAQLKESADGHIWRRVWQLEALGAQMASATPNVAALRAIERALYVPAPAAFRPTLKRLGDHVRKWTGGLSITPELLAQAERNLIILDQRRRNPLARSSANDRQVREAFAELASLGQLDDVLEEFRQACSHENYQLVLSIPYVQEESRRSFLLPIDFETTAGDVQIQVQGQAKADVTVDVVPNSTKAELRVDVRASATAQLDGQRDQLRLQAWSDQRLNSWQTIFLGTGGIDSPGPNVGDHSCTSLQWLERCVRSRTLNRFVTPMVQRVVARRLSDHDPAIARHVEQVVHDRINDEGFDIAYRINGNFGKLHSDHLPADGSTPRQTIHSEPAGIVWKVQYARQDELGALSRSPLVPASQQYDVALAVHESAINNWADCLANFVLDEATFLNLLKEDLKLVSDELAELPPAREAAVVQFAADVPLRVRFADRGIDIRLRLQSCRVDGKTAADPARTVHVRYRIATGNRGLRFVREAADFGTDQVWTAALARFLPSEIQPAARFRNTSFKSQLSLRQLTIDDGWLVTGSNRESVTSHPAVSER